MGQNKIMHIATIERQARELEGNMQLIDMQIIELENFKNTVENLIEYKNKELLSSIGGRVYIKANIEEIKKLFVEVGAGIVVKKTPEETVNIVREQLARLGEARIEVAAQSEAYHRYLEEFINEIEKQG